MPNNSPPKPFVNPYQGYKTELPLRDPMHGQKLVSVISDADFNYIYCIRPTKGTLQTTINLLWHEFVKQLKLHNITDITDQPEYELAAANLRIVFDGLPGSTAGRPVSEATASNDGSGKTCLGAGTPDATNIISNVAKPSRGGRRKRGDVTKT